MQTYIPALREAGYDMPRVARYRENVGTIPAGGLLEEKATNFTYNWPIDTSGRYRDFWEHCYDSSGKPYEDSALNIYKRSCTVARVSTSGWVQNPGKMKFRIRSNTPAPMPSYTPMKAITGPNWNALISQAMANANPNTEVVDVPLFFYELKDLPRMLGAIDTLVRDYGNKTSWKRGHEEIVERVASDYLGYQFGWKPFLNDIRNQILFVEEMKRRSEYLRRLAKGRQIQRSLGTTTGGGFLVNTLNHYTCPGIRGKQNYLRTWKQVPWTYKADAWYTMRLELLDHLPMGSDLDKLSKKLIFGLSANAETVWNAIPFTWLIDWFTNIGDMLNQTRGTISYRHKDLNIMWHYVATADIPYYEYSEGRGLIDIEGKSSYRIERKRREVRAVPHSYPTFTAPAFSANQVSIIASLGMLQGRRGVIRN